MDKRVFAILNRRFDRNVSALILLALTIFGATVYHIATRALVLAEQYEERFADELPFRVYENAHIETNKGTFTIHFLQGHATTTIRNFTTLVESGLYDGTKFHRVIKDFMIQGGDPLSKGYDEARYGTGGPGYTFDDEISSIVLGRGVVAMANSGPDTNGSQFFVITAPETPWIQGRHTAFATVIRGMEVVDAISAAKTKSGDIPVDPIIVERILLY